MKRFFISFLAITSWGAVLAGPTGIPPFNARTHSPAEAKKPLYNWVKSSDADGLTTYWSAVEGSQVIAFKGEGIVDAPIEKVASIIVDTTRSTEWVNTLVSSKVVRTVSPKEFVEYDHAGIPFPFDAVMSDRDFVSDVTLEIDPKTQRVVVDYKTTEDSLAPPVKKYVRATMTCQFRMVPMTLPGQTYVEAEVHADPKGQVPKWLVNFFQEGWPHDTFEALRKQAGKSDIQVLPVIKTLLKKTSP